MKSIDDLPNAIYSLFSNEEHVPDPKNVEKLKEDIAQAVKVALSGREQKPQLRMSNLGRKCERQLWYAINKPELAEPPPPRAQVNYMTGHIFEAILSFLSKEADFKIEDEQKEVDILGVKGHIDASYAKDPIDFKSTSPLQFAKFKNRTLWFDDPFGYIDQLRAYIFALGRKIGAFVAIDKSKGDIAVLKIPLGDKNYEDIVQRKRQVLENNDPPPRAYNDVADGGSGNRRLGVECSYCPHKGTCWPGLRVFLYKDRGGYRPRYLTKVEKEPKVPEGKLDERIS